jgi:imidazolonepropionase-like amidohydrolase
MQPLMSNNRSNSGTAVISLESAATVQAACLLGQEAELGVLEPGKMADVVAVRGDPLKDINLLKRMDFVMKEGIIYKRDGKEVIVEPSR